MQGAVVDIVIHAGQIVYTKRIMAERIAQHAGQNLEQIELDFDRDRWFAAEEAYGIVDHVIFRAAEEVA